MKKTLQILTLSTLLGIIPFMPHPTAAHAAAPEVPKMTTVSVTGESERQIAPDYAILALGLESKANTVAAAKNQNDAVMSTLISQLQQLGISKSDIQTTNFRVSPESYYDNSNQRKNSGYTVDNTITIKIKDLTQVSKAIDSAAQAGASDIHSLYFGSEKSDSFDDVLTIEAIQEARHKADVIAGALGMSIDGVENIYTQNGPTQEPMYERVGLKAAALSTTTPIEAGSLIVRKQVSISYRLK